MTEITNKLTDAEWVKLIRSFCKYFEQGLRVGQSYSNALADVNMDAYNEITGTDVDCFYNDNKVVDFIRALND
jgi:hypothetical protein